MATSFPAWKDAEGKIKKKKEKKVEKKKNEV